ncbi:MAG: ATP-binding protein [Fervidobacterium sp.]|uniref:ATP-binding protein n=1 Tax=Fervidobacterium sp. TaxID=1871331 RepID=UPI00404AF1CA
MFINRFEEKEIINNIISSSNKELLVLYGRRRVGKSALLKEVTKGKNAFYYTARKVSRTEQLETFSKSLGAFLNLGKVTFETWEDALRVLFNLSTRDVLIVVLDEFQYIAESNKEVLSVLQVLFDEYEDSKIKLVLCGSSISFMEGIFSEKNPLFGRKTAALKLLPVSFEHLKLFIPEYNYHQLLEVYSIIGGIPYHLRLWDGKKSVLENVENLFLKLAAPLKDEPSFILFQELRDPGMYQSILEALASGRNKLNEIASFIGEKDSRKLHPYLKSLAELKLIRHVTPALLKNPHRTKNFRYEIDDQIFRFWYRYIFPYKEYVDLNEYENVLKIILEDFSQYVSFEFERQSRQYTKKRFNLVEVGSYWTKDIRIDIIGQDKDGRIYAGEVKWKNKKIGMNEYIQLRTKTERLNIPVDYFVLISKSGFDEELLKIRENLYLIEFTKENGWIDVAVPKP